MSKKYWLTIPIMLLIFLTVGMVCANENVTADEYVSFQNDLQTPATEEIANQTCEHSQIATKIETKEVTTYYKEKSELVSYLKDSNNQPVSNKRVFISIDNRNHDGFSDDGGNVVLKLNLKPGTYTAKISFAGDDNYTSSFNEAVVKVKKTSLAISTGDFKTYFESGFYFKAKVINKITKKPVEGLKLAFKVYKNNKYRIYWAVTDANGIAKLKKNLKVGKYKVVTSIRKNSYLKSKKSKSSLTIKPTAEMGCSSLCLQVSKSESVAGFRRDATNAKLLHIVKYKLNGKHTIKQYKTNSYFFHSITTADGWMMGTGGWDNPTVNSAIEKLAGKIVKSGKIKMSDLKKIQNWERKLPLGHFSIKSPNGNYGLVWSGTIITGKLSPGEYIKVPNVRSLFGHGKWTKFSKNPAKAAIKVGATDSFGINRRDITVFHWKMLTKEGKTTSSLKVYAANDDGKLTGRSTGHLKDDIKFKGKFISKNKLPKSPLKLLLGVHKFGNIDKLIKIQTKVRADDLTKMQNESDTFDIAVKDKKTGMPIKKLKLKLKIGNMVYTVKTDKKGIAKFSADSLEVGTHKVVIYSANDKYYVSAKGTIRIT